MTGLFNLVLYADDSEVVEAIAGQVEQRFPCHIIPVVKSDQLPYLVFPQLLPDLPLHLFWATKPDPDDPLFIGLQPYITRLIYDPTTLDEIPQFIRWLDSKQFHGELSDLKWAHLEGWRLVFASVFNGPRRLPAIARAKRMTICYSGPSLHALYLVSWLAARLGWKFLHRGEEQFFYGLPEGLTVEVTLKRENEVRESILSVETLSHAEEHTLFSLEENFVKVSSNSPEKCGIPYSLYLPKASRGTAFVNELFKRGTSYHYREMVKQLELL